MKIFYIAFARMPTEKAHGLTIAKSCESFARAGAEVTLIIPKRATPIEGDIFSVYGIERNFKVMEIRVPDLMNRFGAGKIAFSAQYLLFYAAVKLRLLFESRKVVLYTREAPLCLLRWLGYRIALEPHAISSRRALYFFCARQAYWIIPISNALKNSFVAAGFDEKNILVAPSGVDLSVFDIDISKEEARAKLDLPRDARIALYTGNFTTMEKDKGINDTIEALKHTPEVTFVAAGGRESDIARYGEAAKKAGVADRVILRGYSPQKTLAIYQKAADVLLMPFPDTPHYRNHMSPVKMFEYMASGRPIIASDLPTIREVLNDSNAIIIPPGDARTLANAMSGSLPEHRGVQALNDVRQFSWCERSNRILAHIQA